MSPARKAIVVRIHKGARREEGREGENFWLFPVHYEKV